MVSISSVWCDEAQTVGRGLGRKVGRICISFLARESWQRRIFRIRKGGRPIMTNVSSALAYAALLVGGGQLEPAVATGLQPRIEQVRMVCDQYCTCWRTRYRGRQATVPDRDDLICQTGKSDRAYYNGYYRQGPATGLGFEGRYPVREFAFPF